MLDPRRKALGTDQLVNGSAALKTRAGEYLRGVIAEFADAQTQPSAPVPAPVLDVEPAKPAPKKKRLSRLEEWLEACLRAASVLDVEPAEPAPKKKRLSRLEERREARVRAVAGGDGDSGSAEPQAAVTGRHVLIGREVLVYLVEQGQLDVDTFNLLGFWNRRGADSVCPTTSTVASPAGIPYLAFIARLCHEIEATTCQAERNFSALAYFIGDLRSRMRASMVERMVFIWLKRLDWRSPRVGRCCRSGTR